MGAGSDDDDDDDDTPNAKPSLSGIDLQTRVEEMEQEQEAAIVLIDHSEKIAQDVLKENNIKLSKGRKMKPIQFDSRSYGQGIEDSKEIDINQRAIRDEVKVKKEEGKKAKKRRTSS